MSKMDDLTVGEARQLAGLFSGTSPMLVERDCGVRIVILQRGWVVVGHTYQTNEEVRVEKAAVIRHWGTTRGLGELASCGPLKETVLDDCPTVHVHPPAVVAMMEVKEDEWRNRR